MKHFTFLIFVIMSMYGCASLSMFNESDLFYLGEPSQAVDTIDVHYDEFGVGKKYIIVGSIVNRERSNVTVDVWKKQMISKAKSVGGDAIIFAPIQLSFDPDCPTCAILNAKVIKYIEEEKG